MFEWSQGTALKTMMNAGIPGAGFDDWLEGWMFGFVQSRLELQTPLEMLDVAVGAGERPYLETFRSRGCTIETIEPATLVPRQADSSEPQYDFVTLLSLGPADCLRPLDLENPLPWVEMLLNAATWLKPGGALVWSYLYSFSSDPDNLHSLLEPAAVYQALVRRNFRPLSSNSIGVGRMAMLFDIDTIFVPHLPILKISDRNERVTRICAGVSRDGPASHVRYLEEHEALRFAPAT